MKQSPEVSRVSLGELQGEKWGTKASISFSATATGTPGAGHQLQHVVRSEALLATVTANGCK